MITDTRKKLFFVVNPIAGGKSKSKAISIINSEIDNLKFEIQIEVSKGKEHLQALAQDAIKNNFYAIIVVGGDGTVNALATEIINAKADILLGIIPVGSGNGLARHLKISSCYYKACKIINNLNFTKIDAISLNGLIALNVVGLGFEALVAKKFAASKTKRGLINYVRLTIKLYKNYKPIKINLTLHDNEKITMHCLSLSIANGSQFGNNIFIAPLADIQDGLLDIVIIKKMHFFDTIKLLYQLLTKRINKSKLVTTMKVKHAYIQTNSNWVHLDGEPVNIIQPLHIKLQAKALKVITP